MWKYSKLVKLRMVFCCSEDTELLREMILSIPLHVTNEHKYPANKKFKVIFQTNNTQTMYGTL